MSGHSRFIFFSSILLFVLLVSLVFPLSVSAQEEIPPPTATEQPVQPPLTEEPNVTEEPATDEAAATEAPVMTPEPEDVEDPAVDQPVTTEVPAMTEAPVVATEAPVIAEMDAEPTVENEASETAGEPPAAEDLTVAQALQTAPEGTEVVLLNDEGSPEPLASVEAVEIFQTGDPYYTVAGITYYFMPIGGCGALANCTESATPIQTAINYLNGTAALSPWFGTGATPTDGTIYVSAGTYTENVTLDGNVGWNAGANKPAALTLSGAGSSSTILDGSLSITNMNVFTLSGFTVIDADNSGNASQVIASNNTGAMTLSDLNVTDKGPANYLENGIMIEHHSGDITLTHITANNNSGTGVSLDNCIWLGQCSSIGSVNISDSTFNGNDGNGLLVNSGGEITLASVTANGNDQIGLFLFLGNMADITLIGVTANKNGIDGANLLDCGSPWCQGNYSVNITDSSFNENNADGLMVRSNGKITLSNVTFNSNGGYGALLDNCYSGPPCSSNVSVANSTFNGNANLSQGIKSGLRIDSGGNVTILCSQVQHNGGVGAEAEWVDGMLILDDVTFSDNLNADIVYPGTPVITSGACKAVVGGKGAGSVPDLLLHIVDVSGGEQIDLDCSSYSGTQLVLPNGDRVIFPCPLRDQGQLTAKTQAQLPGPVGDGFEFLSAMDAEVLREDGPVATLNMSMIVDFVIPKGKNGADLAILRWDETQSKWVEVPGGYQTRDGRFVAASTFTGVFVLVTK